MSNIERDELIDRLMEADRALFASGDTVSHRQSAETALRVVEDYIDQQLRGAVTENEKLRLQVAALENDGMELAAKLGEAEEQIAPFANPTGAVDPETLERHRRTLDAAVRHHRQQRQP